MFCHLQRLYESAHPGFLMTAAWDCALPLLILVGALVGFQGHLSVVPRHTNRFRLEGGTTTTDLLPKSTTGTTRQAGCLSSAWKHSKNVISSYRGVAKMKAMTHTLVGSGLALFGFLANAEEAATKPIALDIKPQPMVDALNGWAQQTGFQIIWPDEESTSDLAAPRVKGRLTAQAALDKLLVGTSLTYEFINERTVAIHEQVPMLVPTRATMSDMRFDNRFMRIAAAQVDEAGGSSGNSTAEQRGRAIAAANEREVENNNRQRRGVMEEVIVTAQKRAERLEDVPISITALSGCVFRTKLTADSV